MILSRKDIEEMAAFLMRDFQRCFFGSEADEPDRFALPTPIDQFASQYLNLDVTFDKLSADGSVYGLTAYADADYELVENGITRTIHMKQSQVLLDESFIQPANVRKLCGRRRFTLAHECAHQILYQMERDERQIACFRKISAHTRSVGHGERKLRTREDWNEWQANVLGAAILMPKAEVERAMLYLNKSKPLTCYGGKFYGDDQNKMDMICSTFGVSVTAAKIRLQQLEFLVMKSSWENPMDIWP